MAYGAAPKPLVETTGTVVVLDRSRSVVVVVCAPKATVWPGAALIVTTLVVSLGRP